MLSSPDRLGGNQRSDIFVKKREGTGGQKGRRSMIHSIHVIFFFSLSEACVLDRRECVRAGVMEKEGRA